MTPSRTGWCAFGASVVIGFAATQAMVHELTNGMPRTEIYEALARDSAAVGYSLVGWFITLLVSTMMGYGASQCIAP